MGVRPAGLRLVDLLLHAQVLLLDAVLLDRDLVHHPARTSDVDLGNASYVLLVGLEVQVLQVVLDRTDLVLVRADALQALEARLVAPLGVNQLLDLGARLQSLSLQVVSCVNLSLVSTVLLLDDPSGVVVGHGDGVLDVEVHIHVQVDVGRGLRWDALDLEQLGASALAHDAGQADGQHARALLSHRAWVVSEPYIRLHRHLGWLLHLVLRPVQPRSREAPLVLPLLVQVHDHVDLRLLIHPPVRVVGVRVGLHRLVVLGEVVVRDLLLALQRLLGGVHLGLVVAADLVTVLGAILRELAQLGHAVRPTVLVQLIQCIIQVFDTRVILV